MEQTCVSIWEGFIANPTDCKAYGYCKDGKLLLNGTCPGAYIYNSEDATCDYPSRFQCKVGSVESICQYSDDISETFADPNDCSRYCQCKNKKPVCNRCPDYQKYDSSFNKCVWNNDDSVFCLSDSICRLIPNGVFASDNSTACGGYAGCANGKASTGKCEGDFYFSAQAGGCVPGTASCPNDGGSNSNGESAPGAGINTPLENNKEACSNYNELPGAPKSTKFVSDGVTCFGYYACVDENGPGVWYKCNPGLHFDENEGKCVTPYTVACTHDRCGNINQEFVGKVSVDCKEYLICKDQVETGTGTCPENYFFNEFNGACVQTKPDYAICTDPPTSTNTKKKVFV